MMHYPIKSIGSNLHEDQSQENNSGVLKAFLIKCKKTILFCFFFPFPSNETEPWLRDFKQFTSSRNMVDMMIDLLMYLEEIKVVNQRGLLNDFSIKQAE